MAETKMPLQDLGDPNKGCEKITQSDNNIKELPKARLWAIYDMAMTLNAIKGYDACMIRIDKDGVVVRIDELHSDMSKSKSFYFAHLYDDGALKRYCYNSIYGIGTVDQGLEKCAGAMIEMINEARGGY